MKSCQDRLRREQPFLGQLNKDKIGQIFSKTKNTSMSDFNIILGGLIDKIGKHFFEKGAKQAAKEFNYATDEHHETVTGMDFIDNKGRPLKPPRNLTKIKLVGNYLKEIMDRRGIDKLLLDVTVARESCCWDVRSLMLSARPTTDWSGASRLLLPRHGSCWQA